MAADAPTWSIAAHAIANPKGLANDVMTALLLKISAPFQCCRLRQLNFACADTGTNRIPDPACQVGF
jgi:hypothetical protein